MGVSCFYCINLYYYFGQISLFNVKFKQLIKRNKTHLFLKSFNIIENMTHPSTIISTS